MCIYCVCVVEGCVYVCSGGGGGGGSGGGGMCIYCVCVLWGRGGLCIYVGGGGDVYYILYVCVCNGYSYPH